MLSLPTRVAAAGLCFAAAACGGAEITASADPRVKLVSFHSPDPADGVGCDYHPSVVTHQKLGQVLTDAVKQELGW